uniref:Uncharacterized protein n=1 Tax=viral metagenome TaxID=1070528 RepID=A0A6M3XZC7_9ZZZZ
MADVSLRYDGAFTKYVEYIKALQGGELKKANSVAARGVASRIKDIVAQKYRTYREQPYGLGRTAILRGKDKGHWPERPGRSITSTMSLLANNVVVVPVMGEGYRIQIRDGVFHPDPKPGYPEGVPLQLMASWIENAHPVEIPMTLRMMVYLKLLREGKGGFGTKTTGRSLGKTGDMEVGSLVFTPPQRPVWRAVAMRITSPEVTGMYTKDLARRIRQLAKNYGVQFLR